MPLTVAEALQMEIFRNCRLLTGQAGLHNEILWVNILEILDDLSHIEPGEFLITTAHDFSSHSEGTQQGMIELFAARKLAAMAIQTGYYLKEIPPSFIHFSEEHNIPLIEIPPEVSFKNLTRALMMELLHNEQSKSAPGSSAGRYLEEQIVEMKTLWKHLIDIKNPADISMGLERYDLNLQDAICIQTFAFQQKKEEKNDQAGKDILSSAQLAVLQTLRRGNYSFLIGREEDYVAVLIQAVELEKLMPAALIEISRWLAGELSLSFPGCHLKSGLSSVHSGINELNNALDESIKALQLARLGLIDGSQTVFFPKIGLYRLIMDIKNMDTLKEIYRDTIMPLVKYDSSSGGSLLFTLQAFLKHGSIKEPAAELFVHRHTMKYRLGQINKLTGLNPFNPDDALQLNMGLHIFHYLKARNLLPVKGKI